MPPQPTPQSAFRQAKLPWILLTLGALVLVGTLLWICRPAQEISVGFLPLNPSLNPLPKAASRPSPRLSPLALAPNPEPTPQPELNPAPAHKFQRWLQQYVADRPGMRSLGEAPHLLELRRPVLLELIQKAPGQALALAVPPGLRPALPAEFQERLEIWVEGNARLTSIGPNRWQANLDGRTYEAYFAGSPPSSEQHQTVFPLVGIALEGHLAIAAVPWRVIEPGEPDHNDAHYQISLGGERLAFSSEAEFQNALAPAPEN